jgi:hypothetical protein
VGRYLSVRLAQLTRDEISGALSMTYGRLAIGAMLAASALSSSATAQETRKFDVDLRAAVAHDSNVSRSSPQLAALRGLSLADTTYSPTLALDVLLPVGRESVFLKGSAGYVTHDRNSRLDAERFDFTGGVNARLNICSTKLTADYFRGRSELGDITVVNVVKNVLELKKASLDVHCARESGLGLTGSASYDWANNSTTQLKSTDYNTTSFSGGIYYTRPRWGRSPCSEITPARSIRAICCRSPPAPAMSSPLAA